MSDWIAEPWKVLALVNAALVIALIVGGIAAGGLMGICFVVLGAIGACLLVQGIRYGH